MGKTFKDEKDWTPFKKDKGKRSGFRRGCKIHKQNNCPWCEDNLRWPDQVLEERAKETWEDD